MHGHGQNKIERTPLPSFRSLASTFRFALPPAAAAFTGHPSAVDVPRDYTPCARPVGHVTRGI